MTPFVVDVIVTDTATGQLREKRTFDDPIDCMDFITFITLNGNPVARGEITITLQKHTDKED